MARWRLSLAACRLGCVHGAAALAAGPRRRCREAALTWPRDMALGCASETSQEAGGKRQAARQKGARRRLLSSVGERYPRDTRAIAPGSALLSMVATSPPHAAWSILLLMSSSTSTSCEACREIPGRWDVSFPLQLAGRGETSVCVAQHGCRPSLIMWVWISRGTCHSVVCVAARTVCWRGAHVGSWLAAVVFSLFTFVLRAHCVVLLGTATEQSARTRTSRTVVYGAAVPRGIAACQNSL